MKINKITSIITAVLLSLLITSCGGGAGGEGGANAPEGTITLNFGSGQNARAAAPTSDVLAQLTYTVQLKGPAVVTAGPTKKGEQRLTVTAPVGTYTLTVTATLDGKQYAEGTANNVKIEAGKTTAVKVTMTLADGSGFIIITDFDGSSIADFKAWLDALPSNNTPETAYNAKLNVSNLVGGINDTGSLGNAIGYYPNDGKYVSLDLSGSKFTAIPDQAFNNCRSIVSIILPDTLQTIGDGAFYTCESLKNITIPADVTTIGNGLVFGSCSSLTSVTFECNITNPSNIGDSAFGYYGNDTYIGNLREKYLASSPDPGGPGTYTRQVGSLIWAKQ